MHARPSTRLFTFLLALVLVGSALPQRCAAAFPAGDTLDVEVVHGATTRRYDIHVPSSVTGATPVPLVLDLHGYTSKPADERVLSGMNLVADAFGFLVAYPEGYDPAGTARSWNAGGTCCGPALAAGLDDVGLMRAIVADVAAKANVDPTRIYAMGLSNGGAMSHRLGCDAADLFAAVASVAAPLFVDPFTSCTPSRPIPVLHFAGLTDGVVPYLGGTSPVFPEIVAPSSPASHAYWTGVNGCGAGPAEVVESFGGGASCETHTACNGGVQVGLCSIHGTLYFDHVLFSNAEGLNLAQRIWSFFSAFSLPPSGCGDGVVAAGETCDVGGLNGSPGACCTASCQLAPTTTVCRAATGACDPAETCDGATPACPADVPAPDGDGDGACDAIDPCTSTGDRVFLDGSKPVLKLAKIDGDATPGNDRLSLGGALALPSGTTFADLRPDLDGMRLVIDAANGTRRVDVSLAAAAYSKQTGLGWKAAGSGKSWTFVDKGGVHSNGIGRVVITDRATSTAPGLVKVTVAGANGSYPVLIADSPVRAILTLGDQAAAAQGVCAESVFLPADCDGNAKGNQLLCKR